MSAAPNNQAKDLKKFAVVNNEVRQLPPAPKGSRFIAGLLDGFFSTVLVGIGAAILKSVFKGDPLTQLTWQIVWPMFYFVLPTYTTGQTLGKKLLKIQVVHENPREEVSLGKAFLREFIGKFFSAIVFLLGYVRILSHPDGKAWHDGWAKTRVVSVKEA